MSFIKTYFWLPVVFLGICFIVMYPQLTDKRYEPPPQEEFPDRESQTVVAPPIDKFSWPNDLVVENKSVMPVIGRDVLSSIDKPTYSSASDAKIDKTISVIGVAHGQEARAYSRFLLDKHEIVNDTFADKPVAVTW